MESTPVCGVAIRKEVVAPLDAPSLRSDIAVGITPHEQSGSGMPSKAAFTTEPKVGLERYLWYSFDGTNECNSPAKRKPSNK